MIFAFGWIKDGRLSSFEANDVSGDGKIGNKMQLGANQVVAMRKVLDSIMTQNIISNTD